ncbi:MAG: FtsX-like permease family protein [Candidatus Glassbacteria bacterium]|nr:FtsX-like permease family protein [Candidatus Glassbacteria bacterium]
MELRDYLKMGLEGLSYHKIRSLLTMLGIILGVASVIAMLSIGEGAKREALAKFEVLGVNNIIVREKRLSDQELEEARAKFSAGLSLADAGAIGEIVSTVERIAPQAELEVEAKFEDKSVKSVLVGATPDLFRILNYDLSAGVALSREQCDRAAKVCLLGSEVARDLFPSVEPLGRQVKINDQWFEVSGVIGNRSLYTETVGELAARNLNQDIYIPLSAFLMRFDKEENLASEIDQLTLKVADSDDLVETGAVIRRILERRHHNNKDFDIVIPFELLKQEEKERRIYNIVLGSIAAISLLVGGIGIMNIMLASVLERTREIGIRRALGAKRHDIQIQFLLESVGLSLVGGLIGIALGIILSVIVGNIGDFSSIVSPLHVLLAFVVSGGVGVASGTVPARRAASIDPIEALRYE